MRENKCKDCMFFDRVVCKRYPPQVIDLKYTNSRGNIQRKTWPEVDAKDWCGEWKKEENK